MPDRGSSATRRSLQHHEYASVRLAWGQTTQGRKHVSQGQTALFEKDQNKHGQLSESVPHRTMLLLTFNDFSFSHKKYWRRITCDYVPSKFTLCVTARTLAIGLTPSPYRIPCMAERYRNKHHTLLDLPSLYSLMTASVSFWLQIQRPRVRFPALPDFLSGSGSGTGYTQPREVN